MRKFPIIAFAASFFVVIGSASADSITAISSGGGKETTIQNTKITTDAKTGNIEASDESKVGAATVEIGRGTTIQNSEIKAKSDTGNINASDKSEVDAGSVKIQ
ncbi:MAG: hypothetical protein H7832_00740 [Magnetococcus sp. DMHC-6]